MDTQLRRRLYVVALLGAISPSVASGQTSVHHYRYELLTRAQESAYTTEVPSEARGRHHAVETDAQGRITRDRRDPRWAEGLRTRVLLCARRESGQRVRNVHGL